MSGKTPDPPDTPKPGAHRSVDVASLAERAKDEARDATKIARHADDRSAEALMLSQKHAEMIERLPAIEAKLDLAIRPTIVPLYVRAATVAAAAAMLVCASALVALVVLLSHPSSASASSGSGVSAQASNHVGGP